MHRKYPIPTIEIDGIGDVEVDASFLDKSPAEQNEIVQEIIAQVRGSSQSDAPKPAPRPKEGKRDITVTFAGGSQHVYKNAPENLSPEEVTERAEQEFGLEVVALDGGRNTASERGQPSPSPSQNAREAIRSVFPDARITDWKRDPGSKLGKANPSSWHNRSAAAVDIAPIPGMTFAEAKQLLIDAGYPIIEAIDEVNNPTGHATGPHWHFVLGEQEAGFADIPEDDSENPAPLPLSASPDRPVVSRKAPATDGPGFFDMPGSWDQVGEGLALGAGNIVEGVGDTLGIVVNPANVLLSKALGYDNPNPDFGKTLRESMGLPGDEGLTGDVIKGVAGGVGFSGLSKLAAKAVQGAVAKKALAEMGRTPVRDAVAGGGAALGAGIAEREGAPVPVQMAAALAGGATGALGLEKAAAKGAQFLDSPTGGKLVPTLAQQRFEAKQAMNKYKSMDREIAQDVSSIVSRLPLGKKGLRKAEQATLLARIDELETAYLPYSEIKSSSLSPSAKARLKKAMDDRHILSDADIAALEDGTPAGLAVADSLRKVRRLRSTLPSVVDKSDPKVASFLKEALGSTAGSSLGHAVGGPVAGSVGGVLGAAAAKGLRRSEGDLIAAKVEELVEQSRKFARMPDETMDGGRAKAKEALAKLKQDADATLDKPFLAKQAMKKLEDEGRRVAIKNAQDDIVPQGGFRGYLYAQTGLKPSAQDAAALAVLKDGKITPQQFDLFLNDPEKLMRGKVGLSLADRFAAMADEGTIARDPDWVKPELPASQVAPQSLDAQGQPIRSVEAYRAGAAKNTARQLELMRELKRPGFLGGGFI